MHLETLDPSPTNLLLRSDLTTWVFSGGLSAPLALAQNVLGLASESLSRLQAWAPPGSAAASSSLLGTIPEMQAG